MGTPARFTYRLDAPAGADAAVALEWTDIDGRLIERRTIRVAAGDTEAAFTLDTARAVVRTNMLRATRQGTGFGAPAPEATARFVVALDPGWRDYQIVMWQPRTAAQWSALRALGVTAGKVQGRREDDPGGPDLAQLAPLLDAGLGFYVENIATDFYSAYHRWWPDHPENWAFQQARARFRADPSDPRAVARDPPLEDPVWRARVRRRLALTVRAYDAYAPLFYSLADEAGVGDLAAAWDFDMSPASLSGMRVWLDGLYGSLAALDAEWGARHALWPLVMPETTGATLARADGNHAAWSDFKAWMDVSFAHALAEGTLGAHEGAARARAALEGGQIPGWGGYDYSRLPGSVDVLEMYDYARNIDVVRSLSPRTTILTTAFDNAGEVATVWRALLRGTRGLVLWDDTNGIVGADGIRRARGDRLAPVFSVLRGGVGALLMAARPVRDPVAILYSPESFRAGWLVARQAEHTPWSDRDAEAEYGETPLRRATEGFAAALSAAGLQYRFVSPEQVRRGVLASDGVRMLVMPRVLALDDEAAARIEAFARAGGAVIADVPPGAFDGHVRARATPALADLFTGGEDAHAALVAPDDPDALATALRRAGVAAGFAVTGPDGQPARGIETHAYRVGGATLLSVQADDAGARTLTLRLPREAMTRAIVGETQASADDGLTLLLHDGLPVIVAAFARPPSAPRLTAPASVPLGDTATVPVADAGPVLRVEAFDPEGAADPRYAATLVAGDGAPLARLPLALNDKPGAWRLRVTDVLTGERTEATIDAVPPP